MAKGEDITTRFKVDISDLKKGITEANNQIKLANSEFKKASAGMNDWSKSSEGIKAKLTQLKSVLEAQNSKLKSYQEQLKNAQKYEKDSTTNVENLRKALEKAKTTYGANSTEVKKLQTQLSQAEKSEMQMKNQVASLTVSMNNQEASVKNTKREMSNLEASLKNVEQAEKNAAKNGTTVEEELKKIESQANKTESKLSKLASTLSKALVAGAAAAGAGLVALTKSAITAYADYEQLVGGVDTLFKDSSKRVQEYANQAYKTTGMSANEYMETVTGFSASLLQSLGGDTKKAADVADMALTDMSDNANKMGTSMESIKYAYQGFAKQNYTMLDNLKLGYGGTQKEMERLLADATKISGVKYDITNLNDVYQAIHVIQGELGITGTTAQEAATTISGSVASMKSAWTNLLVGFADGTQDLDVLISNFISSVGTVASNLVPRIQQVLSTILQLIINHLPEITAQIVSWMGTLVDNIISALPPGLQEIVSVIKDGLVVAFQGLINVVTPVVKALSEATKWLSEHKIAAELLGVAIAALTTAMAAFTIQQKLAKLAGEQTIATFVAQKVAAIASTTATTAFGTAMAFLTSPVTLVVAGITALIAIIVLLVKHWDEVKAAGAKCWEVIKNAWNSAGEWFSTNVIEPIKNAFSAVVEWLSANVIEPIENVFNTLKDWFVENIATPISNFYEKWIAPVVNKLIEMAKKFVEMYIAIYVGLFNLLVQKVITPIFNKAKELWDKITGIYKQAKDWFSSNVIEPVTSGFSKMFTSVSDFAKTCWNGVKNTFSSVKTFFTNAFQSAYNGIKTVFSPIASFFAGIWNKIKNTFSSLGTKIGDAISGSVKTAINGIISKIESIINKAIGLINGAIGAINALPGVSVSKISKLSLPRLAKGGLLDKGARAVIAGENGAEAIVPLEKNKYWIGKVADEMMKQLRAGTSNNTISNLTNNNTNNFTQNIYAPKQPSRIELYRQTKNLLSLKGGAY